MKEIKINNGLNFLTILLGIWLATSLLNSCDKIEPIGPTDSNYFNNKEEYEKALIGVYDMLQSSFWNVLTSSIASDDLIAGGDAANFDQPTLQKIDKMTQTPLDYIQLRDIWVFMYAGVNRANYLLEFKDKIDFEGKEEIIAETYFLRAYFIFELVKFYGDIPLKIEERNGIQRIVNKRITAGEEYELNRVGGIADIYSLIEEDLKEAIEKLPKEQGQKYEVSKGAAQALLGKIYLYHGKYDKTKFAEAAKVLKEVIDGGSYTLVEKYADIFTRKGENGPEAVFEIQYTNVEGAGWGCIQCSEGNYFPKFNAPRAKAVAPYIAGWGFSLPTQNLFDAFKTGDTRRDATIFDLRSDNSYEKSREDTGFFSKKYLPTQEDEDERLGSDPLNYHNNYRAIRYADVLLMAAEAEVQSGGSVANATSYLNQVRERAFENSSNNYPFGGESDLLEAIYKERRLELAGEGHRFFDLVRTGKAKEVFDAYNNSIDNTGRSGAQVFEKIEFTENKNEVFPIPLVELNLADATERWGQNQGY